MDVPDTDMSGCEETGLRCEFGINGYVEQPLGSGADRSRNARIARSYKINTK